ncbi:MAG TPA: hypothetical protein VIN66_10785 [Rheinheimera sp.]|uniref:hypothetical protein n=1 Tax=Rheinheimera sp. TaxID=1869214 RepID=UPI002F92FAAF
MQTTKPKHVNADNHELSDANRRLVFNNPRALTPQEIEALREDKKLAHEEAMAILKTMTLPKV